MDNPLRIEGMHARTHHGVDSIYNCLHGIVLRLWVLLPHRNLECSPTIPHRASICILLLCRRRPFGSIALTVAASHHCFIY
jgi:hypothetical protein